MDTGQVHRFGRLEASAQPGLVGSDFALSRGLAIKIALRIG